MTDRTPRPTTPSRRTFLQTSAATLAAGAATLNAHAGGSDVLRVGLIGCGGRGTGAAGQALTADPNLKLVACGDAFPDRISKCLGDLQDFEAKLDVPPERRFVGFDAYKSVIDNCDVVLLATPPGFRPMHLKAAIGAGKHVFCEKPMAVDGPGVRSVLQTAELAKQKKLCLVSGFCYRYDPPKRETVKRIHDGAIGDVLAIHASYNTGTLWNRDRTPEMTDMQWQMRNWYYFTWLSGDHIVEQHIHNLDKAAWVLKNTYPISAVGLGGRQVRTDPKFGHIYDHHAVIFEYQNGTKVFSFCRQMAKCFNDVSDHVIGTKGSAQMMRHTIDGATQWRFPRGRSENMYQVEHNELFAAIRAGELINDGDFMAKSTLMGILGRMATYTGQKVTWEQALNSQENLMPASLDWNSPPPPAVVALPGTTKVV
ncbi:MAG TPA: Gfo/Idh/MocA family oxidoreductase [Gemmataceae bacterium]|jgi:predicted dehydrogenase|nr:Gfo/Idh/MocA family oxidoreductase [Gemmataceae bacterium]